MTLTNVKFPVQLPSMLRIEVKLFLGHEQYYLYRNKTMLRLLDPEEVEELLELTEVTTCTT